MNKVNSELQLDVHDTPNDEAVDSIDLPVDDCNATLDYEIEDADISQQEMKYTMNIEYWRN